MRYLKISINKVFKGSIKSFSRFPASIISAIIISIVAIIKIVMGWEMQRTYSLLFDSIQLSFVLAAVFSMAAVTFEEIKAEDKKKNFIFANMTGLVLGIISFILLYFFSGIVSSEGISHVSNMASLRLGVGIFASAVAFVYIVSNAKAVDSFSDAFFITHKAFAVSALYGLVIMIGVSGVLGAFQALVYRGMSFKIYQYLGVAVSFLTFTLFLGYFPSFRSTEKTSKMKSAEEEPRFIFVLFGYILVPIMLALTVVLLIWSLRVVLSGMDVSFNQLSSITSSYVIIGIWLHIMVSKHDTKLSNFYKTAYPFSAILVLAFEAWALVSQVKEFGFKATEYTFTMLWFFALISVVLIILLKDKSYKKISVVAVVITIISVLPFVGYQDVTFKSQVNKLEVLLIEEGLLGHDKIIAAEDKIEILTRSKITDAVDSISYSEKTNKPIWFKEDLNDYDVFRDTFGFNKTYGVYQEETEFSRASFILKTELIDISDYPLALNINPNKRMDTASIFEGKNGQYEFIWTTEASGIPKVTVKLEDKIIIEESLEKYLSDLQLKYPLEGIVDEELPFEEMSVIVEGGDLSILLVFDNIDIYNNKQRDNSEEEVDYYVSIHGLYIKYK